MTNFALIFVGTVALNAFVTFRSSDYYKRFQTTNGGAAEGADKEDAAAKRAWQQLIQKYLAVYLLAALSDWFQGPYVYALYAEYGYSQHDIAVLFVAGFGSSMVFGSFVGGMADWGGRKAFVILFAVVYAASCMTKREYTDALERATATVV
jgi:Sugar-tranasporters, 12 TM